MKKCALYTRVSTNSQAELEYGSCEAQKDKILSYINSQEGLEVYKEYSDPGFTGSNIERPALKELLKDVVEKKVEFVMTYKIDRLTRSSKDFYSLIEFFEKYGVSFVSVSERFDTSSASGRLLRNIMLTFAQFEREMTAERTKDKLNQRAEKGMWNGGNIPIGYKPEGGKLFLVSKEASAIREIFERFVSTASLARTMDLIKEKQIKSPKTGELISHNGIFTILRNPVYIGKMRWGQKLYQGIHEPIISKELFDAAQSLTKERIKVKRPLMKDYLLKGLIKCAECGSTMTPCFTNKKIRRYYYYKCVSVVKNGPSACSIKEINLEKIEGFLIENLSRLAQDKQYIDNLAFKITHESSRHAGFELTTRASQNLSTRVQEVLINFKNSIKNCSAIEKILIIKKNIKRVKFSREELQVTLFIGDTENNETFDFPNRDSGGRSARIRGGHPNSCAPDCTSGSLLQTGEANGTRTRDKRATFSRVTTTL